MGNLEDPAIEWLDSNTLIQDSSGTLTPAGTCIKIHNNIIFLNTFTLEQLEQLKNAVLAASNHEIQKRT